MSSEKAKGKRPAISPTPGSPGPSKRTARDDTSDVESIATADTDTASLGSKNPKAARQTKETTFGPVNLGGKGGNWLKADGQEAMLAAYLGFTNTSDLRKFAISWVCLAAERYFREPAKGLRKNVPFQLLSKPVNKNKFADVTTAPETVWSHNETDDDSRKRSQKAWIVAWCLYKMASDVELYNSSTPEENEKRTRSEQKNFLKRHEAEFAKLNLTFPSETMGFPSPNFGPIKDTPETELEVFNRCWEVQRYLASGLFKSTWKKRFASPSAINNGTTVNQSNFPSWMQTPSEKVHSSLDTFGVVFETDKLPPISVTLQWVRGPEAPRHEETERAIQKAVSEGMRIPVTRQILPWDPRLCPDSYQFRDKLRRFLGCRDLGLNIQNLRLKFRNTAENIQYDQDAFSGSWDELRADFSNPAHQNLTLSVTLEPFNTGDPLVYFFEDTHAPADIQECVSLFVSNTCDGDLATPNEGPALGGSSTISPSVSAPPGSTVVPVKSSALEQSILFQNDRETDPADYAKPKQFDNKEDQQKFYDGYSVQDRNADGPHGRIAWQNKLIDLILGGNRGLPVTLNALPEDIGASDVEQRALGDAEQQAQPTGQAELQHKGDSEYYTLHAAFSGSDSRAGPCLDVCLDLLLCEKKGDKYISTLLEKLTDSHFFHYQITGAVGIILKIFGTIDAERLCQSTALNASDPRAQKVLSAANKLRDIQIHGAMLADGTGFGKTKQCLLAKLLYSLLTKENKPTLLLVPASLVSQWVTEIEDHWVGLRAVISYSGSFQSTIDHLTRDEMTSLEFPDNLAFLLDQQDSNTEAKRSIIVTSFETHKSRTLMQQREIARETAGTVQRLEKIFTKHAGIFGLLIADEAHKIKNKRTVIWALLKLQEFQAIILATATPMFNAIRQQDLVGLVELLGAKARKELTPASKAEVKKLHLGQLAQIKSRYAQLDQYSSSRLAILDPRILRRVVRTRRSERHAAVSEYFNLVLNMIAIQRSQASELPLSDGTSVTIRDNFKKTSCKTVLPVFQNVEKLEYQVQHKLHAEKYLLETRRSTYNTDAPEVAGQAVKFNTSDMRYRTTGEKTDVAQLNKWRAQGLTAEWIHRLVRQKGELLWPVQSAMKLIRYLTEGSPRLRAIFHLIQRHGVLEAADPAQYGHHQKALIVECCPLNAWYLEVVLNAALIGTRAMHAKLNEQERKKLACDLVILSAPGRSWSQEAQAFGRCLRINSLYDLTVIRIEVPESHDQFRSSKQAEKASFQLAVNAREPAIESLLLKLLQQLQAEVDSFYGEEKAKQLLEKKAALDKKYEDELTAFLDMTSKQRKKKSVDKSTFRVAEVVDLEATPETSSMPLPRADRTRKPPSYYSDIEYDKAGKPKEVAFPSPNPSAEGTQSDRSQLVDVEGDDIESQNDEADWGGEEDDDNGDGDGDDGEGDDDADLSADLRGLNASTNKRVDSEEFDRRMKWKYFADATQPDDQTRYEMALLTLPSGKVWGPEDLRDPQHPLYFEVALRLLYNKLRGSRGLHLSGSIHIPYSQISDQHLNKLGKLIDDLMDEEVSRRKMDALPGESILDPIVT
ncbi:SNF2-like protein [Penicillium expansum]|uniref:SNF2-like protein n=1 Tax=Penicillium expansum TaxID=27334 RepID=A0A0A2J1M0_PENEN|nr:SNF2-like protein [Penicillium expansum]KGO49252.1 SNF2-like protein [Penicillium expansum]KGO49529.1 SNF2-like protein [Penicillium expansum]KGO69910.1 SNF2-like protein [Penicillium expansum]